MQLICNFFATFLHKSIVLLVCKTIDAVTYREANFIGVIKAKISHFFVFFLDYFLQKKHKKITGNFK